MDGKIFKELCARLGGLTGAQVQALREALCDLDARMQALTEIEGRGGVRGECPHCGQGEPTRWGLTRRGLQRMRCRSCRRTFCAATGTAVAGIHSPDLFQQAILDMFGDKPRSCRRLAAELGLDKMTVWRWRQKVIHALVGIGATTLDGIVEADEKFFRESRKGSREWVNHLKDPTNFPEPDRPRWHDHKRLKLTLPAGVKYQVGVLTLSDRAGARRADVLPDRKAPTLVGLLAAHVGRDAVLCSDRDPAYALFARRQAIPHYRIDAKKGPHVIDKAFHIQNINSLHDRFARFMRPFRGPATKNLQAYSAWFIARLAQPEAGRVGVAWKRLLAA